MPRTITGTPLGLAALAFAALLGACTDDRSPTAGVTPVAADPSYAISVSSSNFQQCANGGEGGEPCFYINGVLNDSKSLYRESDVIAERFVIPGLVAGHTYRLVFDYGWEKAVNPGHMNYDFIAGWNVTLGVFANPCGAPLGNGSADIRGVCNTDNTIKPTHSGANADSEVIPDAIFTTNAPLGLQAELAAAIDRFQANEGAGAVRFDILGGSFPASGVFENVTYTVGGDDVTARFTVRFVAGQSTVMLLWGGHFADTRDFRLAVWDADKSAATPQVQGNLTGAAGQSGAPFHFTQQYIKDQTSGDSTGIGSLSNNVQGNVLEAQPKASITIAPSAVNGIGEPHTFTVTLLKDLDDGAGSVPAAGEDVTVTLTPAGGATVSIDAATSTCDDAEGTDANGRCIMVFTSNTAGTVTGSASATLLIGAVPVPVSTDGSGDNSAPAVKTFVAGSLRWLKHDGAGALLGGAVFTVCRTHRFDSDLNSGAGGFVDVTPDVCVDVTDNSAPDTDATDGEFQLDGLVLGRYTVKEKTAPPGYILDPDTETTDLSTTDASETFTTAFVNIAPDAFITIGPENETNNVSESHTFTAVMTAIPNGGVVTPIEDFTITVSPAPSTPGTTTCTAYDATAKSKTCQRTINSNVAGTFKANATASVTISGLTLTRDTDPATTTIGAGPGGSGEATKVYVAPNLTITKTPDAPTPPAQPAPPYLVQAGGTATFTITVKNTGLGDAFDTVIKDTLPNSGLDWSETATECDIASIDADAGPAVVTREELTCELGTLSPNEEFSVQVSTTVPQSFTQVPPSPAGTPLQIDGDLIDDGAGNDWDDVGINCLSTPLVGCRIDDPSGQQDGSFGKGTSEDSPVPSIVNGGVPPEKSDLLRFYIATERFVSDDFLYLAWERVQEPNGTTNMDFELNQSTTLSSNGVTPVRMAGDILVKYDLAQGGTEVELGFHRWVTAASAGGQTASQACEASNRFPCWGKVIELTQGVPTDDVVGAINTGSVTDPINPGAPRSLDARTFGEARINLQESGIFQPGVCLNFGRAYLKSRSSDSFTAAIKDFVRPVPISINTCQDVFINNTAWVSASNFTPPGANKQPGDGISDAGQIKVVAPQTGSALRLDSPTGQRFAVVGPRITQGTVVPTSVAAAFAGAFDATVGAAAAATEGSRRADRGDRRGTSVAAAGVGPTRSGLAPAASAAPPMPGTRAGRVT